MSEQKPPELKVGNFYRWAGQPVKVVGYIPKPSFILEFVEEHRLGTALADLSKRRIVVTQDSLLTAQNLSSVNKEPITSGGKDGKKVGG